MTIAEGTDISGLAPSGGPRIEAPKMPRPKAQPKPKAPPQQQSKENPIEQGLQGAGEAAHRVGDVAGGIAHGVGEAANVLGTLGHAEQVGAERAAKEAPFQHMDHLGLYALDPIDWGKLFADDASTVYHIGQANYDAFFNAFLGDGKARATSVHNIWQQSLAHVNKSQELNKLGPLGDLIRGITSAKAEDIASWTADNVLTQTSNPLNAVPFAGAENVALRMGSFAAPGVASSVLDPKAAKPDILWAVLGGVASGGRLPDWAAPVVKNVLGKGGEDAVETLNKALEQRLLARSRLQNPDSGEFAQHVLDDVLSIKLEPGEKVLAKAAKPLEEGLKKVTRTPKGELMITTSELEKEAKSAANRALKRYGVTDMNGFIDLIDKGELGPMSPEHLKELWQNLRMPHDLMAKVPGSDNIPDPAKIAEQIGTKAARRATSANLLFANQIHTGIVANAKDMVTSMWRSLNGRGTTDRWSLDYLFHNHLQNLGKSAVDQATLHQMARAWEPSAVRDEAWNGLSKEAQHFVSSMKMLNRVMIEEKKAAGEDVGDLGLDFMPRVPVFEDDAAEMEYELRQMATTIPQTAANKSRSMVLQVERDAEGAPRIVAQQAHETIFDANRAVERQRTGLMETIMQGAEAVPSEFETDSILPGLLARVKKEGPTDELRKLVERRVNRLIPKFDENPITASYRYLNRQLSDVHARDAISALKEALVKDEKYDIGVPAAKEVSREAERVNRADHYVHLPLRGFENIVVHPSLAKLMDRNVKLGKAVPVLDSGFLAAERKAVAAIMYLPTAHAWNLAGRMGAGTIESVLDFPSAITKMADPGFRKLLVPGKEDLGTMIRRARAFNMGVVTPTAMRSYGGDLLKSMSSLNGEPMSAEPPGYQLPEDASKLAKMLDEVMPGISGFGKAINTVHNRINNAVLWDRATEFATAKFEMELAAAQSHGNAWMDSAMYAARRANSWMGHVRPEDTNQVLHKVASTIFFAPNWARSFAELLTGVYRRQGYGLKASTTALNEAKALVAIMGFQKITGNLLNYGLSGHLQDQNLPGNQDNIEITEPWALAALAKIGWIPQNYAQDVKTKGSVVTFDNPFARQQIQTETGLGYESGQPASATLNNRILPVSTPYVPGIMHGMMQELASHLSPLASMMGALGNVNPYYALTSGNGTIFPNEASPGLPSSGGQALATALYAAAMMTPAAYWAENASYQVAQGQPPGSVEGPFGTHIPKAVLQAIEGGASNLGYAVAALTGTTAPHLYSQKAPGTAMSNAQVQQYHQAQAAYQKDMATWSQRAISGQVSPSAWLKAYKAISNTHQNALSGAFYDSYSYTNGSDGLLNRYENLYNTSTVDGVLNPDLLAQNRQKLINSLTAAQVETLNAALTKNDNTYPMLKLYHAVENAYYANQASFAQAHDMTPQALQDLITQASSIGSYASYDAFLAKHPVLDLWEKGGSGPPDALPKKAWESTTGVGLMYGLFYPSNYTSQRLEAYGLVNPATGQDTAKVPEFEQQVLANLPPNADAVVSKP